MDLKIKIIGIEETIDANSFYCRRRLGQAYEYGANLLLNFSNRNLLEDISERLNEKNIKVSIEWKGEKVADQLELFQCKFIPHEIEPRLQLICLTNKYNSYIPGAFTPRKRVLNGSNMLDLFRNYFSDLVDFDDMIEFALERIKFPDKNKTNIIQYLDTDHEMLFKVLNWYNHLVKKEEALIISGAYKGNKFQLEWAQPAKCKSINYASTRKLENKIAGEWLPQVHIGFNEMPTPEIYKQNFTAQNVCYILNRGSYGTSEWNSWKSVDMPSYYKNRFVYQINDVFTDSRVGNLGWVSRIATLAREEDLNFPSQQVVPWSGIGRVKAKSDKDFWMEVELPDFESGSNTADVRVTSYYSGHHGDAGLHLIPEHNTEVLIHKGSNWLEPVLLINNVRSKAVIEKAPFWKLEDTAKWDFTNLSINLKKVTTAAEDNITFKTSGVTAKIDSTQMDIS